VAWRRAVDSEPGLAFRSSAFAQKVKSPRPCFAVATGRRAVTRWECQSTSPSGAARCPGARGPGGVQRIASIDPNAAPGAATPLPDGMLCPECGYDLRGLTSNHCPECGFGLEFLRTGPPPSCRGSGGARLGVFVRSGGRSGSRGRYPRRLMLEFCRPVDARRRASLRWMTIGHVMLPLIAGRGRGGHLADHVQPRARYAAVLGARGDRLDDPCAC